VVIRAEEETRMAAALGIRKEFPLLNEHLIATALAQDPLSHASRAGEGRLIARKAFEPFLPPFLCSNPSKWRAPSSAQDEEVHLIWRRSLASLVTRLRADHHPLLSRWWNLGEAWRLTEEAIEADEKSQDDLFKRRVPLATIQEGLETLRKISFWLRWLEGDRSGASGALLVRKSGSTAQGS
jgi:hypothetical protein